MKEILAIKKKQKLIISLFPLISLCGPNSPVKVMGRGGGQLWNSFPAEMMENVHLATYVQKSSHQSNLKTWSDITTLKIRGKSYSNQNNQVLSDDQHEGEKSVYFYGQFHNISI